MQFQHRSFVLATTVPVMHFVSLLLIHHLKDPIAFPLARYLLLQQNSVRVLLVSSETDGNKHNLEIVMYNFGCGDLEIGRSSLQIALKTRLLCLVRLGFAQNHAPKHPRGNPLSNNQWIVTAIRGTSAHL